MEENGFKFQPATVIILTLVFGWLSYVIGKDQLAMQKTDFGGLAFFLVPIGVSFLLLILPMAFKMLTGIPAIKLTADELVDNVFGVSIDWENVQHVEISGTRRPYLSIDLKDKDKFYAGIYNPAKRLFLRLLFTISPGDVSIALEFVSGNNEAILAMTQVYWNRFYGRSE